MALKVPHRQPISLSVPNMSLQEFRSRDTIRRLWWLHDSFWHAALIKELGPEEANRFNLEVSEKIFRIRKSLVSGDGRCVIELTFERKGK